MWSSAVGRCCGAGARAVGSLRVRAMVTEQPDYEAAVSALNGLQTNAAVLAQIRRHGDSSEHGRMQQYLQRVGLAPADLHQLNAIHVSGTKGKGSVCAMTESILRCHGFRTGLFTSPHLLEVRERIRINGRPLSRASFVVYFWDVYNKLSSSRHCHGDGMPSYFRFLTVMAFSVFLQEKVDVAVVEVGIGGTYDSTNIMEQPVVCGVASLGYDHTDILGPTLSRIAWHKGGICKEGRPALTVPQPPEALAALASRATELRAQSLHVVPPLATYPGPLPVLTLSGRHQHCNASLAVQLCRTWLQEMSPSSSPPSSSASAVSTSSPPSSSASAVSTADGAVPETQPFLLPDKFRDGLQQCRWAGRNQVVHRGGVAYYMDGAHTPESVEVSAEWFLSETSGDDREQTLRLLLFNLTGHRDPQTFLRPLLACGFQYAVFCPNIANSADYSSADQTDLMVTRDSQLTCCYANQKTLRHLLASDSALDPASVPGGGLENGSRASIQAVGGLQTRVFVCVSDAVQFVESLAAARVAVLVTGSLRLVGTAMHVLGFTVDDV